MNSWTTKEILRFLNRKELVEIQETSRVMNNLIKKDFASKPLRILDDIILRVNIKEGDLLLSVCRKNSCFVLNTRQWQRHDYGRRNFYLDTCEHFYPFEVIRPFLSEHLRFKRTHIAIGSDSHYTPEHITLLESISHIWSEQKMKIRNVARSHHPQDSVGRIMNSSIIQQCRMLTIFDKDCANRDLFQCANLYSLRVVDYTYPIDHNRMMFLKSSSACRLQIIIQYCLLGTPINVNLFRLENSRTNEVLQLSKMKNVEIKAKFNVDIKKRAALVLERFRA
ncbi:hypothetical protein Ddc_11637 [Ditylenchus destructor]|nr:hypothetical protein Ddc_11637 [Ditylenchus destructor]